MSEPKKSPNEIKTELISSDKLTALTVLIKLLGIIERVLPAFLVAWNNQLRQKNKSLELTLEKKEIETEVMNKKEELQNVKKSPEDTINDFLKR